MGTRNPVRLLCSLFLFTSVVTQLVFAADSPEKVEATVRWGRVVRVSKTSATLQVVPSPCHRRGAALHDQLWGALRNLKTGATVGEIGTLFPGDPTPGSGETIRKSFWNLSAALYAYVYAHLARQGRVRGGDGCWYLNDWPPPAERVLPFMHGLIGPRGWSCTEWSRIVELPLRGGDL